MRVEKPLKTPRFYWKNLGDNFFTKTPGFFRILGAAKLMKICDRRLAISKTESFVYEKVPEKVSKQSAQWPIFTQIGALVHRMSANFSST